MEMDGLQLYTSLLGKLVEMDRFLSLAEKATTQSKVTQDTCLTERRYFIYFFRQLQVKATGRAYQRGSGERSLHVRKMTPDAMEIDFKGLHVTAYLQGGSR